LQDLVTPGALAGIFGALMLALYDIAVQLTLHLDQTFLYFAMRLLMYDYFQGQLAYLIGLVCHLTLGSVYGIVLAYIVKVSTPQKYLFKGALLGLVIWIMHVSGVAFFRMPGLYGIQPPQALIHIIGNLVFGLTAAVMLKYLTHNFRDI